MRRILVALLITLVLGATLVAAAGMTETAAAEADDDTLVIPLPGPGATARYTGREIITEPGTSKFGVDMDVVLSWGEPVLTMDRDFHHRAVAPLAIHYTDNFGNDFRNQAYYDLADGMPYLHRGEYTFETGGFGLACIMNQCTTGASQETDVWVDYYLAEHIGPCGALGPWFGTPLAAGDQVEIGGDCRRVVEPAWNDYTAKGWEEVHGLRSLTFRSGEHHSISYASASPFPTRITAAFSSIFSDQIVDDRLMRLELVDHTSPEQPYAFSGESTVVPGPGPIAPRPWDGLGLDESGIDHPFPMSTAMEVLDNDGSTRFQQIIDAGGYVAEAWGYPYVDEAGQTTWHWQLGAGTKDGSDQSTVRVSQSDVQARLSDLTGMLVADIDASRSQLDYPPFSLVPSSVPTVAQLWERYDAFSRLGDEANRWGYFFACANEPCSAISHGLRGGYFMLHEDPYASSINTGTNGGDTVADHLHVSADGSPQVMYRYEAEVHPSTYGGIDLAPSDSSTAPADTPFTAWNTPAAGVTAGISLLAVLAGLGYYLWPTLKGAGIGMFSRIREDQLLDHPVRREVHDLLTAQPGMHFQQLARQLDSGHGALQHHLGKMVSAGLLVEKRGSGYACYFPKGSADRHVMAAAPILKAAAAKRLILAIQAAPGASSRSLATAAGISSSTASYHLKRLADAGLIERDERGSDIHLTVQGQRSLGWVAA